MLNFGFISEDTYLGYTATQNTIAYYPLNTNSNDASTYKQVTANGDTKISTAQSKFGGASGLFDGTGDYLSVPDNDDWYFGTENF